MSAFEIIDNLDNLDYKFDKEKYIGYEYDDYDIINNKYSEIEDQIFKSLSFKESYVNNRYNYKLAFQKKNKDVLEYIIKKYNINKEFIDKFYIEFIKASEKFNISYDYIYLFLKNSFGDLLINKYTMARFTILVKIIENILKANFKWYKSACNLTTSVTCNIYEITTFDIFKYYPNVFSDIIDFIFIKRFNQFRNFRKYYLLRRIEELNKIYFEDQTQDKVYESEYKGISLLKITFSEYCNIKCLPWIKYKEYINLDEEETKKRFIKDKYLDYYKSIKDNFYDNIYYECNIVNVPNDNLDNLDSKDNDSDDDEEFNNCCYAVYSALNDF